MASWPIPLSALISMSIRAVFFFCLFGLWRASLDWPLSSVLADHRLLSRVFKRHSRFLKVSKFVLCFLRFLRLIPEVGAPWQAGLFGGLRGFTPEALEDFRDAHSLSSCSNAPGRAAAVPAGH